MQAGDTPVTDADGNFGITSGDLASALLDELEQPWVSVLVPWSSQDYELTAAEHYLRRSLSRSLGRKLGSVPHRCRMAATGIPTCS